MLVREKFYFQIIKTTIILFVGGTKAKKAEFPHQALLGYEKTLRGIKWLCGGSLVSQNFVLTGKRTSTI